MGVTEKKKRHAETDQYHTDEFELLCETGNALRSSFGDVRYAEIVEYQNDQWTLSAARQRLSDGQWVEVDFTHLDQHTS